MNLKAGDVVNASYNAQSMCVTVTGRKVINLDGELYITRKRGIGSNGDEPLAPIDILYDVEVIGNIEDEDFKKSDESNRRMYNHFMKG